MKALTDLQRALATLVITILVLGGVSWVLYDAGRDAGTDSVQAKWDKAEAAHATAATAARVAYNARLETDRLKQIANNLKVSKDHDQEIEKLRRARDADRAAVDRAGGLRIPAPTCSSNRPVAGAPSAEAASTSGRDDTGAGTIRLPHQIESDLWALADDADEVSARLRACQAWIVSQHFYGPGSTSKLPLLDRVIAAPNQSPEASQ